MAKKKTKKRTQKKATQKKASKKKAKSSPSSAFMALLRPSESLAEVLGNHPIPRTKAVQKLWAYIKKHKLQDKKNKRTIIPDERLAKVFGSVRAMNMFTMMKVLKKHLKKA